jgi:ankyrin repeat protein
MAYVGNTARLCQSIVDCALEEVREQLAQDGADPNKRDYTGRTPLQLAVQCSTPEIVRALVDSGARVTARILDGRTALHMAAARGDCEIIRILMDKSNANEEAEEEKQDQRRRAKKAASEPRSSRAGSEAPAASASADDVDMDAASRAATAAATSSDLDGDTSMGDDGELVEAESSADHMSTTTGSFVKVDAETEAASQEAALDGAEDEPDVFKIDILAWDVPCSPLHLAIVNGHEDAVQVLCDVSCRPRHPGPSWTAVSVQTLGRFADQCPSFSSTAPTPSSLSSSSTMTSSPRRRFFRSCCPCACPTTRSNPWSGSCSSLAPPRPRPT